MIKARAFAALFTLCFAAIGCGEASARIDAAAALLEAGEFDQAFEAYERLYQTGVRSPRVQAGLGLVLTLQPASFFAGVDLMERALQERSEEELREQLMLAYLSLGRIDLARALIHPDRLSVEQVYSPEITRLRLGLNCLYRPGARALKSLVELPQHPRREFFEVLCGIAMSNLRGRNTPKPEEVIESWRGLRERAPRVACEALPVLPALWPRPAREEAVVPEAARAWLDAELPRCRAEFPGQVSIQRELPALAAGDSEPRVSQSSRSLFDVNLYEPDDPGAELEKPPFRRAPASEPGPVDGPYLPVP
ncbi:MAG: hypothetical protein NXI24_05400 [bacterium]|nr:hypothetical protein [bacterium]